MYLKSQKLPFFKNVFWFKEHNKSAAIEPMLGDYKVKYIINIFKYELI